MCGRSYRSRYSKFSKAQTAIKDFHIVHISESHPVGSGVFKIPKGAKFHHNTETGEYVSKDMTFVKSLKKRL